MSNLNSVFDLLSGLPPIGYSAMEGNFPQKAVPTITLVEGHIAAVENAAGVAVIDAMTSAAATPWSGAPAAPDFPWLVIQGMDQTDTQYVDNVTCLAMHTGMVFKVAGTGFAVGDLVYANAGVITKVSASQQAIGQVIGINTAGGYIIVAT